MTLLPAVAASSLLLIAASAAAQPALRIERTAAPPRLEDYLDGRGRPGERPLTEFLQREPGDRVPASQRTEAYVSYDDDHLYIVFVCHDAEPDRIRARLTRREDFGGDDFVGVILDTFHDRRRAYVLIVNPLGIQMDGVATEGQNDDYTFDTLWRSDGRLTPFGYVVWVALPFKSLRFPAAESQTWGIALARAIPRNNETSFWPYITRRIAGFGQQLATLEGLERISPGRNIQFIPYGAFARARFLDSGTASFGTDSDGRAGLDAKVVVKDAFTIDAALNPDFSQIESDEPQVTINQRFEVFFPERRPFFIENANYFELPIQLFFSRRIADPQVGARVTGKSGGWAIGALASDDRAPGRRVVPGSAAFGDRTGVAVLRAQRDFGEQSSVGVLTTTQDFADSFSRVASVDGRVKVHANWIVNGQLALSRTAPLGDAARTGSAIQAGLVRTSRTFEYSAQYRDIDPDFSAPLGFVQRVNMREVEQNADYNWYPAKGPVVRLGPDLVARALWNHDGRLEDWLVSPDFNVELRGQTYGGVDYREIFERFEGFEFRKRLFETSLQSSWLRWLTASGSYTWGTEINYFPAAGLLPFLGSTRQVRFGATLRPVPPLRLDATYLFSGLSVRDRAPGAGHRAGDRIFSNHILRSRVNYQFTRALSIRTIVDYSTVLPNTALVNLSEDERVAADVLITYLVNPGTAIYVGYADRYENLRVDPFEGTLARVSPLRSVGRQVFVKASYLLRF